MEPRNVLLISFYHEDTHTLARIAERLRQVANLRPVVLITSTGVERLAAIDIARAYGLEVFDELSEQDVCVQASKYNPWLYLRRLDAGFTDLSRRILDRVRPQGILCTINFARGRLLQTARERGIESLYVQWTEVHDPEYHRAWWDAETRWVDAPYPLHVRWRRKLRRGLHRMVGLGPVWPMSLPASCLAVLGQVHRDMCIRAGVPANRVEVTGNVQCDDMYRCAQYDARQIAGIRTALGIPGDQPFLLYAPEHVARLRHVSERSAREAIHAILGAMRAAFPALPRVVKLHPKEGEAERARILSIDPHATVVQNLPGIGELVAASGLVVSTLSSSLLWAVGMDRPAISAFFWDGVDELRLPGYYPGVEEVDSFSALVAAIRRNLESHEHSEQWRRRRAAGRAAFLTLDGKSVERIVRKFASLLRSEPAGSSVVPGAQVWRPKPPHLHASQSG